MSKRDFWFFAAFAAIAAAVFSSLLLRPWMMPGNFGDMVSYHYPLRHLVASTLQEGRLPLWNPYIFAGTPLAANSQAVLFYPASVLHYFLPLSWSLSLDVFLHVLLAALGAQLLLRKWRVDAAGAALLSLAYAFSPFVICRIAQGIPTHLSALAWAPWLWLAALSSDPVWLGLTLTLQVLSGHPQFSLINLIGLAIFLLLRRPSRLAVLAQAGIFALFLGAVQVFPTIEFLRHSVRTIWNAGLASTGYSLHPSYLLTFLYPNALGSPSMPAFEFVPSEFFEMLTDYIGLIPLALAAFGAARQRTLWVMAGIGLFFALGQHNPLYTPLQRVSGLDFLRTPSRFAFLILWALWLAAAAGWKRARARMPVLLAAGLFLANTADLLFWSAPWVYAQDPKRFISANPDAVAALRGGGGRFATASDNLTPNKSMQYRLYNATGYEAFYLAPIAVYTARSERAPAADGSRTYIRDWTTPEMSKLAVRYYVATQDLPGRAPAFRQDATRIYENPAALPFVQGARAWQLLTPEHWQIRNDEARPVTVSQAFYPGWKAWVNGQRVKPKLDDGLFPLLPTPEHIPGPPWIWHFRYLPETWFLGTLVSLTMLTASAGLFLHRLAGIHE